ncbi:MAG: outer membrane protein assembly factor BamA [Alphaproteobacteria bacterium]|nr:outer membrane protein assembly factor BamA [Alphaproteobacteria bacterium]
MRRGQPSVAPKRCAFFLALLGVLLFCLPVQAQVFETGEIIEEVRIEGTQRLEPITVHSYMLIRAGDPYDDTRVNQSVKALFSTGLFADFTIRRSGNALIVHVVENPILSDVVFEGNKNIDDDDFEEEVQLKALSVYSRTKVQTDVQRILTLYRRRGYFAATVSPKIIQHQENRISLVYEITEGPVAGVRRISFVGNKLFSDRELRSVILTSEWQWYRFWAQDDTYDPDRLTYDRELLRRFYMKNGYAEFVVVSAVAEMTPDREGFFVTFTVEEGRRFRFGRVAIRNELPKFDANLLRESVTTLEDEWYSSDRVDESVDKLTDKLGEFGYAFIEVKPLVDRDHDSQRVKITYQIKEGPRVFIDRINIVGNERTVDRVIRREMRFAEGDAFNTSKMNRSKQRIQNLDYFETVEVTSEPGNKPDLTTVNVEVEEKSTGDFSIGIGFSTSAGGLLDFQINERNLHGKGESRGAFVSFAERREEQSVSFTEPYLFGRELAGGFDIFKRSFDESDFSSFQLDQTGFTLRTGYALSEHLRQNWSYTFQQDDLRDVPSTASRFVIDQHGDITTSALSHTLQYDKRDRITKTTEGYFVAIRNDVAGLGGNVKYLRNSVNGGYFHPLDIDRKWILSYTGRVGYIFRLGSALIRINDRFFLGGSNLRGFENSGAGPRDMVANDALGGNFLYNGTIELKVPLGLEQSSGISTAFFIDFGSLTEVDASGPEVRDESSLRMSAGFGVSWDSPFGPVRGDFGIAILKENFDEKEVFRFSFGRVF